MEEKKLCSFEKKSLSVAIIEWIPHLRFDGNACRKIDLNFEFQKNLIEKIIKKLNFKIK